MLSCTEICHYGWDLHSARLVRKAVTLRYLEQKARVVKAVSARLALCEEPSKLAQDSETSPHN